MEPQSPLPPVLLSVAFHVVFRTNVLAKDALRAIRQEAVGFTPEQCAAAYQQARQLAAAAWQLADDWHNKTIPFVTPTDLESRCPGFTGGEYQEAISKSLSWAAK
jgi:hypothetical protein